MDDALIIDQNSVDEQESARMDCNVKCRSMSFNKFEHWFTVSGFKGEKDDWNPFPGKPKTKSS
jgi:hypothetical protein